MQNSSRDFLSGLGLHLGKPKVRPEPVLTPSAFGKRVPTPRAINRHTAAFCCVCVYLLGATVRMGGTEPLPWKAGLAVTKITPEQPVVLLGYDGRNGPFTQVISDLYAKALALEDSAGHRAVIVTSDLVGFQGAVSEPMVRRILEKTGLKRSRLILNASHTHTGPLVSLAPRLTGDFRSAMTPEDARNTVAYTRSLHDKVVGLVVEAIADLRPARLSWGAGSASFVVSRRLPSADGVIMRANPNAPVDRVVPVLRITEPDGFVRGVLFGCACHNVAQGVQNVIAGDYAGEAQKVVEDRYPKATAMFMSGCGADANPEPLGSTELAKKHGATLGQEVCRVLETTLAEVRGPFKTELGYVELPLQQLSRDEIEALAKNKKMYAVPVMARHILTVLSAGETLPTSYEAPLAVWQFGDDLTLVALPGEPVAEYVPLLQKALGDGRLWVAGYNNDCFGYLPTAKVVHEGGHEAIGITLWGWGENLSRNVGFFAPEAERAVLSAVRKLAVKAGRKLP